LYTQWTNPKRELHQAIFFSLSFLERKKGKKEREGHALEIEARFFLLKIPNNPLQNQLTPNLDRK